MTSLWEETLTGGRVLYNYEVFNVDLDNDWLADPFGRRTEQ